MPRFEDSFRGRRVLVTGHTGFTGGWLCTWLDQIGASVTGLSRVPATDPNLFEVLGLESRLRSVIGDICDAPTVHGLVAEARPEFIFHLAAQPIVSIGYADPLDTFQSNVIGTLNVLEAGRTVPGVKAIVCVTTDKVYDNREWLWGYRESDRLGGKDPYSASKSAAEMVVAAYQATMAARGNDVAIASARGGNIIGGGDWAPDRIVPDLVRAHASGGTLELRNPSATRPWQHVLALAHGYLMLADQLANDREARGAWNFGPGDEGNRSVAELVEAFTRHLPSPVSEAGGKRFKESHFLHLVSNKARQLLAWHPALTFDETVAWTAQWYRTYLAHPEQGRQTTEDQVSAYRQRIGASLAG